MNTLSRFTAMLALAALAACGGGGGGDGGGGGGGNGTQPVTYSGNSSAAAVSTSNAGTLTSSVIGGNVGAAAALGVSGGSGPDAAQGLVDVGRSLSRTFRATLSQPRRPDGTARLAFAINIDQTDACTNGGTVRIVGVLSDSGIGTLAVIYSGCRVGIDAVSGQGTMQIEAFDLGLLLPTNSVISFARLTVRGPGLSVDMSGSFRLVLNPGAKSESLIQNIVSLNNNNGRMTKSENLVFFDVYNDFFFPTSYVETISGRVFHSVHGFVDIVTNVPLVFSTLAQAFPGSGEMLLTGAGNARVRVTAVSPTVAGLSLDLDGDGVFERDVRLAWLDLSSPAGTDLGDSDGDGMHNSWETANGLNPGVNDAAGDPDADGFNNLAEYLAGTNPNVSDATLPPPPGPGPLPPGPATGLLVTLPNNSDIVYDAVTDRIYAAVRGNPGSVVPINPANGTPDAAIPVGIDPVKLVRSHDGQYLYVALDGQSAVQRINLATREVDLTITLESDPFFGPRHAEDIAVLPGSPRSIAVSLYKKGFSPRHEGVAIYDDAMRRANQTPGHTGSNVIEFSASATTLYGYNNETTGFGFFRMAVDASGVTVTDVYDSFMTPTLIFGLGVDIRFGAGFIFTTSGLMVDPIARTVVRTFAVPATFGNFVAVDAALSRAFYLSNSGGLTWSIQAFDIGSGNLLGAADIVGATGTASSLIRWGAKGLAIRTSAGQIFMVQSTSWIP